MKKVSIIYLFFLVLYFEYAMAQQYKVTPAYTKVFITETYLVPGQQFCFDIYLTGVAGPQTAGGAWIDFSGSTDILAYVSAVGAVPPWDPTVSITVMPPDQPSFIMIAVMSSSGVLPDEDGDIIVGQVCLECTGPGDAFVNITTIPAVSTWTPADDATINANTTQPVLTIHQVCECTTDDDCNDGLWCTGYEYCDFSGCGNCVSGDPPCDDANPCTIDCDEDTDICISECAATSGSDPCCEDPLCNSLPICVNCEGDFDCDQDVDAEDITTFLTDFGRNQYNDPCENGNQCKGDFSCDGDVDATDVTKFLEDFGRNQYNNPCPTCEVGDWCSY